MGNLQPTALEHCVLAWRRWRAHTKESPSQWVGLTSTSPSSEGFAPGPYQRPPHWFAIFIQAEAIAPRSCICFEPHSGICSYSDIAGVQTMLDEWVRDCVVGVGGSGMLGDIEEVEGMQSKGPGGANGRYGGIGEEYKDQDVG